MSFKAQVLKKIRSLQDELDDLAETVRKRPVKPDSPKPDDNPKPKPDDKPKPKAEAPEPDKEDEEDEEEDDDWP